MENKALIHLLIYIGIVFLVFIVLLFSWLPSPSFKNLEFLPEWLIVWTDIHGWVRTAVPFVPLSVLVFALLGKHVRNKWIYLCLFLLAFLAELVQIFLPMRVFDWMDIVWACVGILTGRVLLILVNLLVKH